MLSLFRGMTMLEYAHVGSRISCCIGNPASTLLTSVRELGSISEKLTF